MSRPEFEAALRQALGERDRQRRAKLYDPVWATAADNSFIDAVLDAADIYAAVAEPAGARSPGRRRAAG